MFFWKRFGTIYSLWLDYVVQKSFKGRELKAKRRKKKVKCLVKVSRGKWLIMSIDIATIWISFYFEEITQNSESVCRSLNKVEIKDWMSLHNQKVNGNCLSWMELRASRSIFCISDSIFKCKDVFVWDWGCVRKMRRVFIDARGVDLAFVWKPDKTQK